MKTSLKHILKRNNISMLTFLKINNINTYSDLEVYCESRNFDYPDRNEYNSIINENKKAKITKEKVKRIRKTRRVSKTQKK